MRFPDEAEGQIVLRLHRPSTLNRAILVDADLNVHGVDEVGGWIKNGADVIVLDSETGDDIIFAHWDDGRVVDPIGDRHA